MRGNPVIVVLLSPPGGGKGTQAEHLVEEYGFRHYSTGAILREEVRKGTDIGLRAQEAMENGELVPDALLGEIVRARLEHLEGPGCILDGYPRNLPQAEYLEKVRGDYPVFIVNITVPEEQIFKRLSGRRFCSNCGKIYNIYFSPPRRDGICDSCGSRLEQRKDDREEVIEERLRVYRRQTHPVIDYYRERDGYFEVDGDREPDQVFQQLREIVGALAV